MENNSTYNDIPLENHLHGYRICYISRYYIVQNQNCNYSKSILELKKQNLSTINKWIKIIDTHFSNITDSLNIDIVIRVLGSNEIEARKDEDKPMDIIGRRIAFILDAEYNKTFLRKYRTCKPLKTLNKKQRIAEINNIYWIHEADYLHNKNIMIIDDVKTTGATFIEISKTINKSVNNTKLFAYCLTQSTRDFSRNSESAEHLSQNDLEGEPYFSNNTQAKIYRSSFFKTLNNDWKKKLNLSVSFNDKEVIEVLKKEYLSFNINHFKSSYLPLVYFPLLKKLELCFCDIVFDINHLAYLVRLEKLNFHGASIVYIEKLPISIKELRLWNLPNLTKFDFLSALPNLQELHIGEKMKFKDLLYLKKIKSLRKLCLNHSNIKEFSPLSKLDFLEELKLCSLEIDDLSKIIPPSLHMIELSMVQINKPIKSSFKNKSIRKIILKEKSVFKDLSILKSFTNLEVLEIDDVFKSLSGLNDSYQNFEFLNEMPFFKKLILDERYNGRIGYLAPKIEIKYIDFTFQNLINSVF